MNIEKIIQEVAEPKGNSENSLANKIKTAYFDLFHLVIKEKRGNIILTSAFLVIQFLQLISFSFSPSYFQIWKSQKYVSIGSFLYYFQYVSAMEKKENIYIFVFLFCCFYVLALLTLIIYLSYQIANMKLTSKTPIRLLNTLFQLNNLLFLPVCKVLISIFNCNNKEHFYTNTLKCFAGTHLIFTIIGGVLILIYCIMSVLIELTNYEYRNIPTILTAKICSNTSVELVLTKIVFVALDEVLSSKCYFNITCTLIISFFIFFRFITYHPFYNKTINKVLFTMYFILFWTNFTVFFSIICKSFIFELNFPILFIGYIVIILTGFSGVSEFDLSDFITQDELIFSPLKMLKKIKFFISLVENLNNDNYRKDNIYLFGFLRLIEEFLEREEPSLLLYFREKAFSKMSSVDKINTQNLLYCHAQKMYKKAIKKFPDNLMLRISYSNFLYEKLHQKHKCLEEINSIEKSDLNFEETFIIFHYKKVINEQIEASDGAVDFVSALAFKRSLSIFKNSIGKVSQYYVEFWNLLFESDEENHKENFEKMSSIGNEIENLIESIHSSFKSIEKTDIIEGSTLKLYCDFLVDILHDKENAQVYQKKLSDLENAQNKFDENNLYHLNYKILTQNEEYKYVVAGSENTNFGIIINISISVCAMFGYKKEELVGKHINGIIPDIFEKKHGEALHKRLINFLKNPMLLKAKRTKFSHHEVFGKTKSKYLVQCTTKNGLVLSEEGDIYFITQILTEPNQNSFSQENCYVLTDNEFNIQHFTTNSLKFLNLNSSYISNGISIESFITEFVEDFLNFELDKEEKEKDPDKILYIKTEIFKKRYTEPREITWKNPSSVKNGLMVSSPLGKGTRYAEETQVPGEYKKSYENTLSVIQSAMKARNGKKFYLKVKPVLIDSVTVGLLFQFTPSMVYIRKHRVEVFETVVKKFEKKSSKGEEAIKTLASRPLILFGSIFQDIIARKTETGNLDDTKNQKNCEYIPKINYKTDSFNFDLSKFSFKLGSVDETKTMREKLKILAEKKLHPTISETSESEESYEDSSEDYSNSYYSTSHYSSSNNEKSVASKTPLNKVPTQTKKEPQYHYYHVNTERINFLLYNYTTGFPENKKCEPSRVEIIFTEENLKKAEKIEEEEEAENAKENENAIPKKKSRKSILITPVEITEKDIVINQLKKNLTKRDMQPTVINLALVTAFILVTSLGIGVILLQLVKDSRTKTLKNFNMIFHCFELNQNLLFVIHVVREIVLLKLEKYKNIYMKDRLKYIEKLEDQVSEYFQRNRELLEEFSAIIGTIEGEEKEALQKKLLNLTLITDEKEVIYHVLPLMSSLLENNMALYNFWNIGFANQNLTEVNTFYFLHNSLNEIMIGSQEEQDLVFKRIHYEIEQVEKIFFIMIGILILYFIIAYIIFLKAYEKVQHRKQSYLAVFYEIGGNVIASSLAKCEAFFHKVQAELREEAPAIEGSQEDFEEDETKKLLSASKKQKIKKGQMKLDNLSFLNKFCIFLFFCFFCAFSSLIAYGKISHLMKYEEIANFINHHGTYQILYLTLFIAVREEIIQPEILIMKVNAKEFTELLIEKFYLENKKEYSKSTMLLKFMPPKFVSLYKGIIYNDVCRYMSEFFEEEGYENDCSHFFYNTMKYGMKGVYTAYVEDLRVLHEKYQERTKLLKESDIIFDNNSIHFYDEIYSGTSKEDLWTNFGPLSLLNTELHKNLLIIFGYFFKEVFTESTIGMRDYVIDYVNMNNNIVLYFIYAFLVCDAFIFLGLLIPIQIKLNQTIFKAKNMLSIIPLEILGSLNQIKKMLDIGKRAKKI